MQKSDLDLSFIGDKNSDFEHREEKHYESEGYELIDRFHFTNRDKTTTIMKFKKIEKS